jgi:hypothetical protein
MTLHRRVSLLSEPSVHELSMYASPIRAQTPCWVRPHYLLDEFIFAAQAKPSLLFAGTASWRANHFVVTVDEVFD